MKNDSHVKILLKDMAVNIRIGLLAHERQGGRRQRVIVNAELFAGPVDYLKDVSPHNIIDYGVLLTAVKSWEQREHVELIETYINEFLGVAFRDPRIEACRVSILKAEICEEADGAGVEVFMRRPDWEKH